MKTSKKHKIVQALEIVGDLLQKCGGQGGTPGPCPAGGGKKPPKPGGKKPPKPGEDPLQDSHFAVRGDISRVTGTLEKAGIALHAPLGKIEKVSMVFAVAPKDKVGEALEKDGWSKLKSDDREATYTKGPAKTGQERVRLTERTNPQSGNKVTEVFHHTARPIAELNSREAWEGAGWDH